MSTMTEIHLPDIGDFKDVPVIEVHVQPGSKINVDDTLITLESDKATMDIPATAAGTVREVRVKAGDRISQGDLIIAQLFAFRRHLQILVAIADGGEQEALLSIARDERRSVVAARQRAVERVEHEPALDLVRRMAVTLVAMLLKQGLDVLRKKIRALRWHLGKAANQWQPKRGKNRRQQDWELRDGAHLVG